MPKKNNQRTFKREERRGWEGEGEGWFGLGAEKKGKGKGCQEGGGTRVEANGNSLV